MSCPINEEQLMQLKMFVEVCKSQPQLLHHPKIAFFKEYIISLGGNIPAATTGAKSFSASGDSEMGSNNSEPPTQQSTSDDETEPESDVELDMEGVIEPDTIEDTQDMGDLSKEVTDEERDQSDEKRSEAMRVFSEQKLEEAIKLYTEAILLNPQSALLFAKRGQVYLKLNKPNACIKDCTHALELNCDSAAAYKFRGRAYRLLGKFEEASHDLCESLKIDYDDQTNEWLNEVKPNAEKLRQHKLTVQRRKEEKEHKEKLRRARKAQEARARAAAAAEEQAAAGGGFPGFPGFPGGAGAYPAGMPRTPGGSPDLASLLNDPEIVSFFQDPEVAMAFQDVSSNPANFVKYQNNPKIAAAIEKLQSKFFAGGMGGGATPEDGAKPATDDDVGLD